MTLLEERIIKNKLRSSLLHFLSVIEWSRITRIFKNVFNIRSTFSCAIYVFRLMIFKHVLSNEFVLTVKREEILKIYYQQHLRSNTIDLFNELQYLRERIKIIKFFYYVHFIIN